MRYLVATLILFFAVSGSALSRTQCPDPPCGGVKEEQPENEVR
jgi:hypothetical protein